MGVLGLGENSWIVVEWEVNDFGTTTTRRFQTWIGVSGDASPVEDVTFDYDLPTVVTLPVGQDLAVGAENEIGQGAGLAADTAPTTDLRVASSAPMPGGSATLNLVVEGRRAGQGVVTTEMSADGVPGVTVATSPITVNPR